MVAKRQDNTIDMNDVVITIEVGSDVIDKARSAEITHIVWSLPSLRFPVPRQPPCRTDNCAVSLPFPRARI